MHSDEDSHLINPHYRVAEKYNIVIMDDMTRDGAMNAAPFGLNVLGPIAPVIELPGDDVMEEVPVLVSKVHLP